jgi:hypothetical protein
LASTLVRRFLLGDAPATGFNRRKMEERRRQAAEKEAAARRATDAQVLEAAGRLIAAWNERQAKRMPMLFSPTIGGALKARHWFLWVCCPACRTTQAVDLRTLDRHPWSAISGLIPALSCRDCRPHAPFAELVASPTKASPTNCETNIRGAFSGNNQAWRMAMNFMKLPNMLRKPQAWQPLRRRSDHSAAPTRPELARPDRLQLSGSS